MPIIQTPSNPATRSLWTHCLRFLHNFYVSPFVVTSITSTLHCCCWKVDKVRASPFVNESRFGWWFLSVCLAVGEVCCKAELYTGTWHEDEQLTCKGEWHQHEIGDATNSHPWILLTLTISKFNWIIPYGAVLFHHHRQPSVLSSWQLSCCFWG